MRRHNIVSMDNPFSGHCSGVHLGIKKERVRSDENVLEHKWVTNEWSYFGNAGDEPMEGSCGSPVLDEEGNVVSFLIFLKTNGWAVGVAASTLEIWGYKAVSGIVCWSVTWCPNSDAKQMIRWANFASGCCVQKQVIISIRYCSYTGELDLIYEFVYVVICSNDLLRFRFRLQRYTKV